MIYFTQLKPRQPIENLYHIHQKLWKAFGSNQESKRDFLFRDEKTNDENQIILVQSLTEPNWELTFLKEEYAQKARSLKFAKAEQYFFKTRMNAVKAIKQKKGARSKKVPLKALDYFDQPQFDENGEISSIYPGWLSRQGIKCGFDLLQYNSIGSVQVLASGKSDNISNICLNGEEIQGYLQVNDPDLFMKTVKTGIGRGKAFGFGMISLMKV